MIIDCSDEFRLALEQELRETYIVHHFRDGKDAQDAAWIIHPDVIILDLMLTGVDGITLLHNLRNAGICPMVLAVTRLYNDYIVETAQELGIEYIIRKPCTAAAVAERTQDLSKRLNTKTERIIDPQSFITDKLNKAGFSSRHKGYLYLQEAAMLMWKNPSISITKELYPAVAAKFSGTPIQVERSIRGAISKAWEQRDDMIWKQFFPHTADTVQERPSNSVFISCISERMKLER